MTELLKQMVDALRHIENAATDPRVQRYEIRAAATEALAKLDAQAAEQAAPVQQVGERSPSTISLEDGAQLVLDGSHWSFRRSGSHIRFLNKFESQFVRAALAARGEKR